MYFLVLSLVFTLVTLQCTQFPDPLPCQGICENTHDPSLIRRASDGLYFRFATDGNIPMFTAPHVQGPWEAHGTVFTTPAKVDSPKNNDPWAPDVHLVGDTYVLFYAASQFGTPNSVIGYTTSPSLEPGSWTDHGAVISSVEESGFNAIDANFIKTGLLGFGSYWNGIQQVALDVNYQPTGAPYSVAHNTSSINNDAIEGSYTFQHGDYWYLTFSSGACCMLDQKPVAQGEEYKIMVCRSQDATGPFVDKNGQSCMDSGGTLVLESHGSVYAPGGQGVLLDGDTSWLYYHYIDSSISKGDSSVRWGVNQLNWDQDGWPTLCAGGSGPAYIDPSKGGIGDAVPGNDGSGNGGSENAGPANNGSSSSVSTSSISTSSSSTNSTSTRSSSTRSGPSITGPTTTSPTNGGKPDDFDANGHVITGEPLNGGSQKSAKPAINSPPKNDSSADSDSQKSAVTVGNGPQKNTSPVKLDTQKMAVPVNGSAQKDVAPQHGVTQDTNPQDEDSQDEDNCDDVVSEDEGSEDESCDEDEAGDDGEEDEDEDGYETC